MLILGVILIIGAMYFLYQKEDPMDILTERYSRGEISQKEFNESKRILETL